VFSSISTCVPNVFSLCSHIMFVCILIGSIFSECVSWFSSCVFVCVHCFDLIPNLCPLHVLLFSKVCLEFPECVKCVTQICMSVRGILPFCVCPYTIGLLCFQLWLYVFRRFCYMVL
jgi:hypothetical protein